MLLAHEDKGCIGGTAFVLVGKQHDNTMQCVMQYNNYYLKQDWNLEKTYLTFEYKKDYLVSSA